MMKGFSIVALALSVLLCTRALGEEKLTAEQIYGCWEWKDPRGSIAFTEICFRKDLTAVYRSIEADGHGGDGRLEWYLKPGNNLVIDEQTCGVVSFTDQGLWLIRCIYGGYWRRQCAQLNERGDDCHKSP